MALSVRRHATVDDFLADAQDFLLRREAEHNLLFGICSAIRTTPELFAEDPPRFQTAVDGSGTVVAATLRTPPFNQVISQVADPGAVDALADALAGEAMPGLLAPPEVCGRFLARWHELTGTSAKLEVAERIFRLERVILPSQPAPGSWRLAAPTDRSLVADWLVAFSGEALPEQPPIPTPLETADRWLAGTYRLLYLWEDGGRPTSLVGAGGETPNGIRIGPVSRRPKPATAGTRVRSLRRPVPTSWRAAAASASCSPISPTRRRTRSTRPSAMSRCATWISTDLTQPDVCTA